jgi:hypothetical protein
MMNFSDQLAQQQEAQRLQQEEELRRQDEERKKREEQQRQRLLAQQQAQPAGMDPSAAMQMMSSFTGGSPAAGGISAAGPGSAGAASGGSSAAAGGISMGPLALAAVIGAHHNWARKKGLHSNADAITGRALYKDSEYYQDKGNAKVGGMGDEMRLAALGSSPADLLRKDTWTEAAKLAVKGGVLGSVLKKIF